MPRNGYRLADQQSAKAVKWLLLRERHDGEITHAGRWREHRLLENVLVDGYRVAEDGTRYVYQFHGCWYHACPRCFGTHRTFTDPGKREEMRLRFERTLATSQKISDAGYILIEKWECDFDEELKNSPEDQAYLAKNTMLSHVLNPREGFFGGRTENFVTYYEALPGEKIKYVDVCSLYPWVCKTGKMPIGHPKVYVGKEECAQVCGDTLDLSNVEGFVMCAVLPPRDLYLPVLPARFNNRLVFTLCGECAKIKNQGACDHQDELRAINGTWVVDELRKAIEVGYKIVSVHEIWQYKVTSYDSESGTGGIFSDYINTFLKVKQEASDWPGEADTPEKRDTYIAEYQKKEQIVLDKEKICKNPGLRSLAKLCLNSFWGKFGQNVRGTTEIVRTREHLLELLTCPEKEVSAILPVTEEAMYVSYNVIEEAVEINPITSVAIAAYVTAQARLKLYSILEKLGERALYCDTDSVIFRCRDGEYEPPVGNYLGDLTDEVGQGSSITSFASGGPKFYSYIVKKPDGTFSETCKVKGITLNFANKRKINHQLIEEFVKEERTDPVVLSYTGIRRTKFHEVVTLDESKTCQPVNFVKRKRDGRFGTLPFGF